MPDIPRYSMDGSEFYYNPECPDLGITFTGKITMKEIKSSRFPLNILRDGKRLVAGGEPFRVFPVNQALQSDNTVARRQRWTSGLGFSGGRLFRFWKGRGFEFRFTPASPLYW